MTIETPPDTLIARLNERAHDPARATDDGQELASGGSSGASMAAPPATAALVTAAEELLGFPLPGLLRQVYREVGNGGFGPGSGLLGLPSSRTDPQESLVGHYDLLRREQKSPPWPEKLLPLCGWGCGIASYVDCSHPDAPVIRLDPNMAKADVGSRVPTGMHFDKARQVRDACWVEAASLRAWLEAWVDGKRLFYLGYGESAADLEEDEDEELDEDDGE